MSRAGARPRAPVVLFLHITRTAGSTLRVALYRQFSPGAVLELDPPPSADPTGEWGRYIQTGRRPARGTDLQAAMAARLRGLPPRRLSRLRLVIGHFFFGIDEHLDAASTYVTILRDPVDRVLSQYHLRRTRHGVSLGLDDYLGTGRDWQVSDGQTQLLAGRWARDTDRMGDALEAAKRNLRGRFAAVGVTERFQDSLAVLRGSLGWTRLAAREENVSEGRLRREDLSPSTLARVLEMNRHDTELHRFATQLLDERLRALPGAPEPAPPPTGPPLRWRLVKAARRLTPRRTPV